MFSPIGQTFLFSPINMRFPLSFNIFLMALLFFFFVPSWWWFYAISITQTRFDLNSFPISIAHIFSAFLSLVGKFEFNAHRNETQSYLRIVSHATMQKRNFFQATSNSNLPTNNIIIASCRTWTFRLWLKKF